MTVSRLEIINQIKNGVQDNPLVYACWLEGADSNDTVDEYSDIDVVLDVEDGGEEAVFQEVETALSKLGRLDYSYEKAMAHDSKLRHRIYHLEGTPETLFLDVVIQSHSRGFEFIRQNQAEHPKVIFDKAEGIKFRDVDEAQLAQTLRERLYHLSNRFAQRPLVTKYVKRGKFLEAMGYYHKYLLEPLIEVLRIRYTPLNFEYGIVHISDHLPRELVLELENLSKITSVEEVAEKALRASEIFGETMQHLEAAYSKE